MNLNPDPTKQADQVVFSHKCKQTDHTKIYLNDIEVKTVNDHKHLGLILDAKLSFGFHINLFHLHILSNYCFSRFSRKKKNFEFFSFRCTQNNFQNNDRVDINSE